MQATDVQGGHGKEYYRDEYRAQGQTDIQSSAMATKHVKLKSCRNVLDEIYSDQC